MSRSITYSCVSIALTLFFGILVGCRQETQEITDTSKPAADSSDQQTGQTQEQPATPETTDDGGGEKSNGGGEKSTVDDGAAAASAAKITLGDPSLTSGIPGDGALTIEQIQVWLDDPANHEPLDFNLPLGLDKGAKEIKGVADNPLTRAKIELGRQLFFDGRLSSDGTVSCASCHKPDHGYAAETQFGVGVDGQKGPVNTPVAFNRILSSLQFWDGRAASLEEQAKGPIANPIEMANTHEKAVETLQNLEGYRIQFEKIFSDGVTIDNVARAIASFERVLVTAPSPYDYNENFRRFADFTEEDLTDIKTDDPVLYAQYEQAKSGAEAHPMSDSEKRGRELFFSDKAKCTSCHVGANLTDEKYHNIGIGADADNPVVGRFGQTGEEKDKYAFKTPTIRNVVTSPPYMHDGSLNTLEEVVEHYVKGGMPNEWLSKDIHKLELTDQDKQDLVEFMKACTSDLPPVETGRLPQS